MTYQEYPSHPLLSRLVECFWAADHRVDPGRQECHRVVPDGCIDIVFLHLDSPSGRRAELRVVGPMTVPMTVSTQSCPMALGVRFRPGGAPALLGLPARELRDEQPLLEEVWGKAAAELADRMEGATRIRARIGLLQDQLFQRLKVIRPPDASLHALLGHIQSCPDAEPVEVLAARLGWGSRRLRRAFDRWVGLSPRQFSRIMRFRNLLKRVSVGPPSSLVDCALECGYYDQPHMNRDFKRLAGVPPLEYFRQ